MRITFICEFILVAVITLLLFVGCVSSVPVVDEPITSEQYDPDQVEQRAQELGLRPVDYLHKVNNERLILYQAHDPNWENEPSINPVFETREEAEDYANRNNMSTDRSSNTIGHSYIVREVNFRYEVRQVNDLLNDLLHTSRTFNDAYEYVVEYSSSHSDLIIYDLKTGKTFEETP